MVTQRRPSCRSYPPRSLALRTVVPGCNRLWIELRFLQCHSWCCTGTTRSTWPIRRWWLNRSKFTHQQNSRIFETHEFVKKNLLPVVLLKILSPNLEEKNKPEHGGHMMKWNNYVRKPLHDDVISTNWAMFNGYYYIVVHPSYHYRRSRLQPPINHLHVLAVMVGCPGTV